MPRRLQRRRTKGWRLPKEAVYVGRPTKWGNPFRIDPSNDYTAAEAVRDFRLWIDRDRSLCPDVMDLGEPPAIEDIKRELAGRDLACWCRLDGPCHADVLLDIANR
ncbi:MAG: DUF4326 domain-containing protein [Alphaproteobacteria bacterium]|jgi:hypothetical protein|nr:DUF4326 domain-containing protein [Alphaproteobacteria bacterium]MDP6567351.1 DUF4326 domain-containing protein [Alphaproteobacteria bacterium]MDP6813069.1 DUF4326 domain-containing protein [Alphaproteobacteria bacterium]|tara:strand:- start:420 stop:737 length:318 start_codon:yes stop_codon:yes gene_type:complete